MTRNRIPSRSGALTVQVNGVFLHSRYHPEREATTFAQHIAPRVKNRIAIVIGEGIPYASKALLATEYGVASIIAIVLAPTQTEDSDPRLRSIFPDDHDVEGSVRRAIRAHIHSVLTGIVETIVWPAARSAAADWMEGAERGVLHALRDLQSELATSAAFGKQWLRSALRATLTHHTRHSIEVSGSRMIVATSGPSLSSLTSTATVASSSALRHLTSHQRAPDVVVHTDSGFWARRYLRDYDPEAMVLAAPLRAVPRLQGESDKMRWMPLRTDWIGEQLAPDAEAWLLVGEQPSVSASMISLVSLTAPGIAIQLAGFDLCSYGLRAHAPPHLNEEYLSVRTSREASLETMMFPRTFSPSGLRNTTGSSPRRWSDGTAAWQHNALEAFQDPIASQIARVRAAGTAVCHVAPSPVWSGYPPCDRVATDARVHVQTHNRPKRRDRVRHARETLSRWRQILIRPNPAGMAYSRPFLDLSLHLAPVETIAAIRGRAMLETASDVALAAIDRLELIFEEVGNG